MTAKKPDYLTALEMLAKAQTELEKGNFGTVRMLLIHARRALRQELQREQS